ncbi:MAG: B12-binding domain-containing radical SAM protein [Candidatus Helarchaeota archaeon]
MNLVDPVYRPPSEARSLLLQCTIGCSAAAKGCCYFCGSYLMQKLLPRKKFRVRPIDDILKDIITDRLQYGEGVRRVFLLDSNALVMKTNDLITITSALYKTFPSLERVSAYACATDLLRKTEEDLKRIRESGLQLLYVGVESGDDQVLKEVNKGVNVENTIKACKKAIKAGFALSITIILGLGGKKRTREHAINTGKIISEISPHYAGALTLMIIPGSPIHEKIKSGEFIQLNSREFLEELKLMVENIDVRERNCVFRTNHASNYLPIKGTLPQDKEKIIHTIDQAINDKIPLRPEFLRGL